MNRKQYFVTIVCCLSIFLGLSCNKPSDPAAELPDPVPPAPKPEPTFTVLETSLNYYQLKNDKIQLVIKADSVEIDSTRKYSFEFKVISRSGPDTALIREVKELDRQKRSVSFEIPESKMAGLAQYDSLAIISKQVGVEASSKTHPIKVNLLDHVVDQNGKALPYFPKFANHKVTKLKLAYTDGTLATGLDPAKMKLEKASSSVVTYSFQADGFEIKNVSTYSDAMLFPLDLSYDGKKLSAFDTELLPLRVYLAKESGGFVNSAVSFVPKEKVRFKLVFEDGSTFNDFNPALLKEEGKAKNEVDWKRETRQGGFDLTIENKIKSDVELDLPFRYGNSYLFPCPVKAVSWCSTSFAPITITNSQQVCLGSPDGSLGFTFDFTAGGPGILIDGSYWQGCSSAALDCYPIRLYFETSTSPWEIAYNSYTAGLVSGTLNKGTIHIILSNGRCWSDLTTQQSFDKYYPHITRWKIELHNMCGDSVAK